MKNKGKLILLIATIAFILSGSYYLYQRLTSDISPNTAETTSDISVDTSGSMSSEPSKNRSVQAAPNFTVYDTDGNKVTFRSFLGKPIVVNLWASWCGPCQSELPYYQEAYEKYSKDVNFVMVDLLGDDGDNKKDAQKLISDNGYSFPVYYDNDNDATMQYSIQSIPLSCFITADGNIQNTHIGAISKENLTSEIEALLSVESSSQNSGTSTGSSS